MTAERWAGVHDAHVVEGGMRIIFVPGSGGGVDADWEVGREGNEGVVSWGGIWWIGVRWRG